MKKPLLFCYFFLVILGARGQSCNCDITLSGLSTTTLNLVWASQISYSPGDTICIPAGNYAGIRFYDFEGTASNPVVFKNCGGQVTLNETAYSALEFKNSKYIHLTGTGHTSTTYGIKITGTGSWSMGVVLSALSTDIEVDHIEVASAGFAGFMAKTDPDCNNSATWRSNGFVMKNLNIHHNYFHDTGGEGIYMGFTIGYKLDGGRNCGGTSVYGHWLENVDVHHNIVENTGWDAIQVNLAHLNAKVRDNVIKNYGTEGRWGQAFALSLGGGAYEVYNNYMENGPLEKGWGMQIINGESGTKVFNNVFVKPKMHGVFLHHRHEFIDPNEGYYIANNTIIEPERAGVHYNTTVLHPIDPADLHRNQSEVPSYFVNNLVVDPGYDFEGGNTWKQNQESYFDFNERETRDSLLTNIYTNIMTRQIDTLGLTDVANNDYSPSSLSSAVVDVGSDLTSWGMTFDMNDASRPSATTFDIGAFEYQSSGTSLLARLPDTDDLYDVSLTEEIKTVFYPNPTYSTFRLENANYDEVTLQLVSMDGRIVFSDSYQIGEPFNVEEFTAGLYFLRLVTADKVETHRLIIR
ncbi:T9SS type A sorting domain-containing protein [Flagellimonas allohymeniacidonis]|uniref:T9SS type A sorting domain-containing protein n=1 Tax=Flagellimonas allohymeniacidonis TaxID=2517819 RepID=A0A4Q8QLP3_9FLAO|nr:T9SS type A sorting domain-containing protein [Allomuricauda hymeniacidonis]TAI49773.1 T9SS type A sorting domain-containing protein [Allomuricauda hymeniacidonis]